MYSNKLLSCLMSCVAMLALASCGGGGGDSGTPIPPPPNSQPPVAVIAAPVAGTTFQAGDTINFAGSATDPEDGVLAASQLTWWAELHHDAHSHPFMSERPGASGQVTIPTRGETSANIFYRFYLRATDSTNVTHVVTRDIQPQTSQVTVTTAPAGLRLTLDGQPITGPSSFTGVVGMERDLVAPAAQNFGGFRYEFVSWNDGGAAAHTIATPVAATTYTATYANVGPATNEPPDVAITNPANNSTVSSGAAVTLTATATDSDGSVASVAFFENGVQVGATDSSAPFSVSWTPSTTGTRSLTARATDNFGDTTTSAVVGVTVNPPGADSQAPVATMTSPENLADNLTGTLTLTASATDNVGVTSIEIQVDGVQEGPTGSGSPHSVQLDSTRYASGQHIVRARARDAAGNVSSWATSIVRFGGSRSQPAGITRVEDWAAGFFSATAFAQTPDGRMFVAQQGGQLRVVTTTGSVLATPFITLTVNDEGERGLLGVALHPNFASNRYVYLYYTTPENGIHNRISRFTANASNPNIVSVGSELRIADLPTLSAPVHNGGAMHFGSDGKLYVAVGDNSESSRAPDQNDPLGKMLRFNDDGSIPSDNPFCTTAGTLRCAVWARGLRNPFTFAVRPSDGRIHINDVGGNEWEEVNVGVPGANYGWPASEGPNVPAGVTAPLYAYDHDDSPASGGGGFFDGCAITGGAFYPDSEPFPAAYRGSYFFTDFCNQVIGRVDLANGNAAYAFGRAPSWPVGMLTGLDGALYVLTQSGITRFSAP